MSRIRTIKPEFWTSEQVVECSLSTRLLFIGLWNFCDAAGRHSFSPKQIKAQVFPSDDISVDAILNMLLELSHNGLITIYDNDDKRLLEVTGWRHQRIDNEHSSRLPGPLDENSTIIQRQVCDDSCKDLGLRNQDLGKKERTLSEKHSDSARSRKKMDFEKEDFERFWTAYGHKQQRKRSEESFAKSIAKATIETILSGVERYHKTRPSWQQIALASSWLNGERWNDDSPPSPNGHDPPAASVDTIETHVAYWREQGLSEERISELKEKLHA